MKALFFIFAVVAVSLSVAVFGQDITSGTISGRVQDLTGLHQTNISKYRRI